MTSLLPTSGTSLTAACTRQTSPCLRRPFMAGALRRSCQRPAKSLGASSRRNQQQPTQALFGFGKGKAKASKAVARPTVVPSPSYNIPAVLLGATALSALSGNYVAAGVTGVLGGFLGFQASRVKFIFGPDALEVRIGEQEEEFDNAFVGGPNTWAYDSFVNWEFWWPGFPVLVYFKETQTKPEGQIHFFPVLFNGKQVYDVMVERCGSTQNSGPK
eukprot:CAMPEP_0206141522 /NCGR_PEP_ID=MMETSP1473-20131121/13230_1 /ASSEMBLY_ACC=CAM_ASM_001109 /TAXON_ID=1461547 /ORGANISM="Stichococcus sp, Strain RCC1054" /LENGTH=215 /DNA_ID=CAMNT_0053536125 /DNA_START=125 /DNA_END=772 /DNA_ORIENTATION=-